MTTPLRIGGALLLGATASQLTTACSPRNAEAPRRPNVLFILADDLGYGDLSCYGQQRFATPHIDSLALTGMRFTQCYAGTTVSAPSRSCLLTGTHSGHTPVRGNIELPPEGQYPLPYGAAELFRIFKQSGYTTGVFGKWGLGFIGSTGDPANQGVDRFYGYNCQLLAHSYYPDHLWSDSTRVELPGNDGQTPYGAGSYAPDLIHAEALRFLDERTADEPFLLFYPTTIPHAELIVPEDSTILRLRGRFEETPYRGIDSGPAFRRGGYCSQEYPRATFAAMVTRLDRYEGGIRVPLLVSWPGHVAPGSQSDFVCAFWDLPATFAELTGRDAPSGDGLSLLPLLEGRMEEQAEHDYLYFGFMELDGREAVRQGPWKLLHLDIRSDAPRYELYNLDEDPAEEHDLAASHPEKVAELRRLMEQAYASDPSWPLFGE